MNKRAILMASFLISSLSGIPSVSQAHHYDCRLINCDCDTIGGGLLEGPYKRECRRVERLVKDACRDGSHQEAFCHETAVGEHPWPTRANPDRPPVEERIDQFSRQIRGKPLGGRSARFRAMRPELEAMIPSAPPVEFGVAAGELTLGSSDAHLEAQTGLFYLEDRNGGARDRRAMKESAAAFVRSASSMDQAAAEAPEKLYNLAKQLERVISFGLGAEELAGNDPARLQTIETALKWGKAGMSLEQLKKREKEAAKNFVDDLVDLLPQDSAGALQGPAQKVFRDTLEWNDRMWSTSTDGLRLVADALETGELNEEGYRKVSTELRRLSGEGPWGGSTLVDFLKKGAEDIPIIGKFLKALWG